MVERMHSVKGAQARMPVPRGVTIVEMLIVVTFGVHIQRPG
jgi:Tfp pilus assembly protein FimT